MRKHIHTEGYLTNSSFACEVFPVVSESKCCQSQKHRVSQKSLTKNFSLKNSPSPLVPQSSLPSHLPIPHSRRSKCSCLCLEQCKAWCACGQLCVQGLIHSGHKGRTLGHWLMPCRPTTFCILYHCSFHSCLKTVKENILSNIPPSGRYWKVMWKY